jgi:hypothetical protein
MCASVGNWNDTCGPAPNDDLPVHVEGHNHPAVAGDEKKRFLVLCSFCLNACHPACAGLCPTVRRVKDDWACPECACVAEEHLNLNPKHLSPAQTLKAASAALHSAATDAVVLPPLMPSKVKRLQSPLNLPLQKLALHGYGGGCLKRRTLRRNKTCFKI